MFAGWVASGDCALPRVCLDIGWCFGCFRVCLVWGLVVLGWFQGVVLVVWCVCLSFPIGCGLA